MLLLMLARYNKNKFINKQEGSVLKNQTLVEITIQKILDYIQEQNLQIGDKLPNEFILANQLSVSRNTIRESIKMLKSKNILEIKQGSGTYISEKKGQMDDPFGFSLLENKRKLTKDLFDIRFILEPYVASLAAQHATEKEIEEMDRLRLELEEEIMHEGVQHLKLDQQFHAYIAKASGNTALFHLIPVINESIHLYNDSFTSEKKKLETIESHKDIIQCIKNRDSLGAQQAMLIHMSKNRLSLETSESEYR